MKIRLSVIMSDEAYLSRFVQAVTLRYADKIDLSIFTQEEGLIDAIKRNRPDIVLIEKQYTEKSLDIPKTSQIVCFTEKKDVHKWNGYRSICKYQKISHIYKSIIDIYAEKMESEAIILKGNLADKKIITFFPGAGGVGASTAAAACAYYLADQGEKVLYLNLEQTGTTELFFSAEGNDDFGNVLYALAMTNGTASVKMESSIRKDTSGVYFYSDCASALDMLELNEEMMGRLFEELGAISLFNWIIVDMDFCLNNIVYQQIERSYSTVLVSDGSETANMKLKQKLSALEIVADQRGGIPLNRIFLIYNRFSSKGAKKLKGSAFKEVGGINRFENAKMEDLLRLVAKNKVFCEVLE